MNFKLPKIAELSRVQRLLAFGGLLLWGIVLLDRVVLKPWGEHAARVRKDIARLEEALRRDQRLLDRKAYIFGETAAYQAELSGSSAQAADMASLIRDIEQLGRDSGLALKAVKPLERTADEAPTVDVEYQGTLQQWVHFVYLLQQSKSLLHIERSTVGRQSEGSGMLQGSLRLTSRVVRG